LANPSPDFDVVVVGAGSSGCALAGRLAHTTDFKVGLVEAGPDYGPADSGRWPPELLDPRRRPTTHDWGYVEWRSDGSSVPEARARVVGGCSTHNQCAVVRARPEDFDQWSAAGNPGWSPGELAPLLAEIEQWLPIREYADDELAAWQRAFLETAVTAGFQRVADIGDARYRAGVAPFHANLKGSSRWNAAFAFLDPVRSRPGLTVLGGLIVDRLVVQGDRAGVLVGRAGPRSVEIHARSFVLAAGVYGSPAILMRSGIGPPAHLQSLGIPVRVSREGVGRNLHDHPGIAVEYQPTGEAERASQADLVSGRLYQSQVILMAEPAIHVLPYQAPRESGGWRFEILAFGLAPRSRGRVALGGRDPEDPPRIDFQFLTDEEGHDLDALVSAVHTIRRLSQQPPLLKAIRQELVPGASVERDADLRRHIRAHVTGYAHPVGTCRMGPAADPGAVVDARGRVHGTQNVFVADAAIMPQIPRANTNLTCFLIGFRIAEALAKLG
jgi:choline dehydrogenase